MNYARLANPGECEAMDEEVLRVESRGQVRVLIIDREAAGNSISAEVVAAFARALDALERDTRLRAVVIASVGERFFCSGGDVKQYRALRTRDALDAAFGLARETMDRIEALPVPVIAALDGLALGGGAELALACDVRIASRGARIGFPYVRLGLMPGWNGGERLLRVCGHARAMDLLLTGETLDAEAAERAGLFTRVAASGTAFDAALAYAAAIEATAPLSAPAIKGALQAAWRSPGPEARAVATEAFARLWLSDDHREAEAAFAEKRAPIFAGR